MLTTAFRLDVTRFFQGGGKQYSKKYLHNNYVQCPTVLRIYGTSQPNDLEIRLTMITRVLGTFQRMYFAGNFE